MGRGDERAVSHIENCNFPKLEKGGMNKRSNKWDLYTC